MRYTTSSDCRIHWIVNEEDRPIRGLCVQGAPRIFLRTIYIYFLDMRKLGLVCKGNRNHHSLLADCHNRMPLQPDPELLNPYLNLLRDIRLEAGLQQVDVARSLGKAQSFVSYYETGERRLDVLELKAVCETCGITLGEFISRLEEDWSRSAI